MSENPQIKVMVVDDHQLLTQSLLMVLGEEPDFRVVATAASVADAQLMARRHLPDVALMDYRLPDGLGTDAVAGDGRQSRGDLGGPRRPRR